MEAEKDITPGKPPRKKQCLQTPNGCQLKKIPSNDCWLTKIPYKVKLRIMEYLSLEEIFNMTFIDEKLAAMLCKCPEWQEYLRSRYLTLGELFDMALIDPRLKTILSESPEWQQYLRLLSQKKNP